MESTFVNIKKKIKEMSVEGIRRKLFSYVYEPSGSRLAYYEVYFGQNDMQKIKSCLENRDFSKLKGMRKDGTGSHRMQCYAGSKNDVCLVQLSEFVPYEFVDITDVVLLKGNEASGFNEFLKK